MRWVRRSVWDVVPRDQQDTPEGLRRRQLVVVATIAVGAVLLGVSLRLEPGSVSFYVATLALAGVWAAGAFVSGRLHAGRIASRPAPDTMVRPVVEPVVLGLALALLFVVGGAPTLESRVERTKLRALHAGFLGEPRDPAPQANSSGSTNSIEIDHVQCVRIGARTPPEARRCRPTTSPRRIAAKASMTLPVPRVAST